MNAVGCHRHKNKDIGGHLPGFNHDPEHKSQVDQVKGTEYVLGQLNIRPLAGDVVENGVEPNKAGRIDQRPCVPS